MTLKLWKEFESQAFSKVLVLFTTTIVSLWSFIWRMNDTRFRAFLDIRGRYIGKLANLSQVSLF